MANADINRYKIDEIMSELGGLLREKNITFNGEYFSLAAAAYKEGQGDQLGEEVAREVLEAINDLQQQRNLRYEKHELREGSTENPPPHPSLAVYKYDYS